MNIDQSIFKAYDIRGIYPDQLDEDMAYAMGRAYATLLRKELPDGPVTIAVGGDMRTSTPTLKERVIAGLLDSGINVDDIGLASTPTFYFGVAFYGYLGGLQVSASHNPKEYNGFKLVRKGGVPVSGDTGIMDLKQMIIDESFAPLADTKGVLQKREGVVEAEVEDQIKQADVSKIKPLKIVADGSNAMGSVDIEALFKKLPCELITMNFELDGTFPAHEADPMKPENTQALCQRVVAEGADLGIAPDGDGDRIFFIDEKGEVIPQAILRGLMAQIELLQHPGAKVAYDIRPGRITRDMIEELGGQAIVTRVGHSLIKEKMIEEDVIFGGESSGHYFYRLPYGTFEAPMVLILKLLQYVSETNKPFSEIIAPLKRYSHSGEINTKLASREAAQAKIEAIKEKYADGNQIFIDGITVEYPDFWFNLRSSNTEPVIRLTVEAKDLALMEAKRDELLALIRS